MTPLNPILHAVTTESGGAASSTPTDERPLAPLTAIGAGIEAAGAPSLVGRVVPETKLSGEAFELLEAVRRCGWALQSGSEELKNNFDIVLPLLSNVAGHLSMPAKNSEMNIVNNCSPVLARQILSTPPKYPSISKTTPQAQNFLS
jgi:hypothetical protein